MIDILIFGLGFMITIATIAAVLLVGRAEAQDPAHSSPESLLKADNS